MRTKMLRIDAQITNGLSFLAALLGTLDLRNPSFSSGTESSEISESETDV